MGRRKIEIDHKSRRLIFAAGWSKKEVIDYSDAWYAQRWICAHLKYGSIGSEEHAVHYFQENSLHRSGRFKHSSRSRVNRALRLIRQSGMISATQKVASGGRPLLVRIVHDAWLPSRGFDVQRSQVDDMSDWVRDAQSRLQKKASHN
jgi:hypothetical protein